MKKNKILGLIKLFFTFLCPTFPLLLQDEALQLCIKISTAIDRVEYMFTTEIKAEVEESESATLHQYYREAMIQGYNFAFEVRACRLLKVRTENVYFYKSRLL